MIHVVTALNRHLFEDELLEFRRFDRDRLAGSALRGDLGPDDGDRRFDGDATTIIDIEHGCVRGGMRLIPSIKPHPLSEVFAHLASERGVPRDPAICEATPMFAEAPRSSGAGRSGTGRVLCGLMEYCLAEGIYGVSGIIDAGSLPRFHDMGWTPRPLGLPELIGEDWVLAVLVPVEPSMLETTRKFHGIDEPPWVRRNLQMPILGEIGL